MQIILIHGEDEIKSYERLGKFIETARARSWEVVSIEDSNLTLTEALSGKSLFSRERFFILKDIKKLGKKETDWLKNKSTNLNGNLVIYHPGVVSATLIKSLPDPLKIEEFKSPKIVFQFMESVRPKNAKFSIELFHNLLKTNPPEFVLTFLARHLRDLYWVKVDAKSLSYESWRVGKLKTQADNFSKEHLTRLISDLSKIDLDIKTSNSEIIPSLDLFLATKLE